MAEAGKLQREAAAIAAGVNRSKKAALLPSSQKLTKMRRRLEAENQAHKAIDTGDERAYAEALRELLRLERE